VTGDLRLFGLPPILSATDLYFEHEQSWKSARLFFFLLLFCLLRPHGDSTQMFGEIGEQ
jgi:hypothetical protein